MSDYYQELKPALNKLSELNVWESLFVLRQYLHDSVKNYGIDRPHFETIERARDFYIPLYLIDFLISASLRYSTTLRSEKSLRQAKVRYAILDSIHKVYEKANAEHQDNILVWLKAYMMNQFKIQHDELFVNRIYKYYYLYSSTGLASRLINRIGITVEKYFQLVMLYYYAFSQKYSYSYNDLLTYITGKGTLFTHEEARNVLENLYATINQIKENIEVDFSSKLFLCHNNAIHVCNPIIRNGDTLYCTVPIYILNAGVEGLLFKLELKAKHNIVYNQELATRFEDYIGAQLEYYSPIGKLSYIKEVSYNKGQNRSSDWIIYDDNCIAFIDCKLKKLSIDSILETDLNYENVRKIIEGQTFRSRSSIETFVKEQKNPLIKDIIELGVDMGKILCCFCDWRDGKIKDIPPYEEGKNFCAILLTLEETMTGVLEAKEIIDMIAYRYVSERRGSDLSNLNLKIISSSTFDKSIPYISKYGLHKHIIEDNFDYQNVDHTGNEFLKERFDTFMNKIAR